MKLKKKNCPAEWWVKFLKKSNLANLPFISSISTSQVRIREATDLPPHLAHFVFCQYTFWGQDEMTVVPPYINPELDDLPGRTKDCNTGSMKFNHGQVKIHIFLFFFLFFRSSVRKDLMAACFVSQSVSPSVCQTFSIHFLHRSYLFNARTGQVHLWCAYAL